MSGWSQQIFLMAFTRSAHALAYNVRGLQRPLRALGYCRGFRAWLVDAEKGHLKSREAGQMNCWHVYRCPLLIPFFVLLDSGMWFFCVLYCTCCLHCLCATVACLLTVLWWLMSIHGCHAAFGWKLGCEVLPDRWKTLKTYPHCHSKIQRPQWQSRWSTVICPLADSKCSGSPCNEVVFRFRPLRGGRSWVCNRRRKEH